MHSVSAHSVVLLFLPWFFAVDCASFLLLSISRSAFALQFSLLLGRVKASLMWRQNLEQQFVAVLINSSSKFTKATYWKVIMMNNVGKTCWVWEMFRKRVSSSGVDFWGSLLKLAATFLVVIMSPYYLKWMLKLQWVKNASILNFSYNLKKPKKNLNFFITFADLWLDTCE